MTVSRKGKNQLACQFIEMDSDIRPITLEYLRSLSWISEVTYLPPFADSDESELVVPNE